MKMKTNYQQKVKVEVDVHDPTLLYVNGKRYCSTSIKTKKLDNITHIERIKFNELNEEQYSKDLDLIVDTLKTKTSTEELLKEIFKEIPPHTIKRIAKRIRDNKPIKKHSGCLGFKVGDCYIQVIGGADY